MTKTPAVILAAVCLAAVLFGCSSGTGTQSGVSGIVAEPSGISTIDEAQITENPTVRTESENVNGMCLAITLEQFTATYNEMLKEMGNLDMLNPSGWKALGEPQKDGNGVEYQYYYCNADKINFTATVQVDNRYIMNIGLGTAVGSFVTVEDGESTSDIVLMKSAVMAAAAGGMTIDKVDTLQDIFYHTTFDGASELWYEGNVYALSINEDEDNGENSTMLFRFFPISNSVKEKWNIIEYESYIATQPASAAVLS